MRLRINQLKAQLADQGRRVTLDDISEGTGINRRTLDNIVAGRYNEIRYDYIDALCAYFNVTAGELIQAEPIPLPLALNIRPDRHGKRVGQASAPALAPATAPTVSAPPPASGFADQLLRVAKAEYESRSASSSPTTPSAADALHARNRAALAPPSTSSGDTLSKPKGGGAVGELVEPDATQMAAFEDRRAKLLAQAQKY